MPEPAAPTPEPPNSQGAQDTQSPQDPQGRLLKMPYDLREPTSDRIGARMWNPDDNRLFTPKAFGWGYTINFYWLAHPLRYLAARSLPARPRSRRLLRAARYGRTAPIGPPGA